jgi:hypothetical protein
MRRRISVLLAMAVMSVMLSLAAVPAVAQSELDQSQTTVDAPLLFDRAKFSQTFTAQKTGTLDRVFFHVGCCESPYSPPENSPIAVKVEGMQSASVGEGILVWNGFFFTGTWVYVPLSPSPLVEAGEQYRLTLSTEPSQSLYYLGISQSDVYSGGEFHYSDDSGQGWITRSDWDLGFETYVTPDTTPPKVDAVRPANGKTGVARGTNIRATFSEQMDPASISKSTYRLFRCPSTTSTNCTTQVTNATVAPSEDGLSATLDPYGTSPTKLGAKTKYKVVVTTGANDVAGNALDQDSATEGNQQKAWYFTTGSM